MSVKKQRDKLIELIVNAKRADPETGSFTEFLADFLLGYGVFVLDDGCDLDHLQELVEADKAGRWIPCSERLPKEKQRVMVRCATVGTTVGWILWGEWMTDLGRGCADVTHWMPLPQPPKEVQGND